MNRYGGGAPSWVSRENEAISRSSSDSQIIQLIARVKELEADNAELKKQLDEITKKYQECKKLLEQKGVAFSGGKR